MNPPRRTKAGVSIQYGYFHCPKCGKQWESNRAYVNLKNNLAHKQDCRKCKIPCTPDRVEPIKCSVCEKANCTDHLDHAETSKHHTPERCPKCRYGYPCIDRDKPPDDPPITSEEIMEELTQTSNCCPEKVTK